MISVVIPLYNKAHCITRTLKTVLNQTFKEFEIVIVNDGSTDNGASVVKQFNDSRIKIISQKNQGVSVARNVGVENSKYEHIAFLDADDEWLPEYLATMKKAIDQFPDAGMYCCAGKVRNNTGTYSRIANKYKGQIREINYFENPHVFTHTSATIVSKIAFNKTQGFPTGMRLNQDYALFFSVALITPVIYCGFMLSIYVGDVDGQTTQRSQKRSFQKEKYVAARINHCHINWEETNKTNKVFGVFERYELRGRILGYLKMKNYKSMQYFMQELNPKVINELQLFELWLYKQTYLNKIAILYIYYTKLIWRSKKFPRLSYSKPE